MDGETEPRSSPPPLPLPLPIQTRQSRPPALRQSSLKRTRASAADSSIPSSDPAFFSSDDARDESVENYDNPGRSRKRQFVGTPWDRSSSFKMPESHNRKASFKRNVDSGFWEGSDSTESLDSAASQELVPSVAQKPPTLRLSASSEADAEWVARTAIAQALENNLDRIDLSGLGLESVSDRTLYPLRSIVREYTLNEPGSSSPPASPGYTRLHGNPQLYLSSNRLRSLPNELFNLSHLTVLSLRNNKLTELPPAIANLKNLVELNIAGNRLKWLPYELLELFDHEKLRRFNLAQNPFVKAFTIHRDTRSMLYHFQLTGLDELVRSMDPETEEKLRDWPDSEVPTNHAMLHFAEWIRSQNHPRLLLWMKALINRRIDFRERKTREHDLDYEQGIVTSSSFVGSTPVAYLDTSGRNTKHLAKAPSQMSEAEIQTWLDEPPPPLRSDTSAAHSLFSLALDECRKSPFLHELHKMLPDDAPERVVAGLQAAQRAKTSGKQRCSVCGRQYIIPRTEWIEFWYITPGSTLLNFDEYLYPFLRRGCSWKCVPESASTSS